MFAGQRLEEVGFCFQPSEMPQDLSAAPDLASSFHQGELNRVSKHGDPCLIST